MHIIKPRENRIFVQGFNICYQKMKISDFAGNLGSGFFF